ncbi:IclR family transcriptional regulator domain-containing protein [Streptomyces sp. CB01580]|uniref:IclR family transcriptional regulator domain-containing protein n=1 Tax=Streptomyces sp. CB01580 TaxID=1703933 RepID=UPI00093A7B5F|nr:IclR family transcriptional regulator C-terminal domain-containing protein [Streptomyces sp. CB01580]OKJ39920.1 IclR family transcriptional regulator [Streptomyces sp. CB01580]
MPPTTADSSVGPLERGLAVLRALAQAPRARLRPSELVALTGLTRSPVDRIATTLVRLGYLREDDRELVLAPRLMELGLAYLHSSGIPEALGPPAEALADELDESVSLAVPDGDAVRFVVQSNRRRTLSVSFRVGDALPAERCAPGELFAADWDVQQYAQWQARTRADPHDAGFPAVPPPRPRRARTTEAELRARAAEARENGWVLDDQRIEPGLVAVAVPVYDQEGRVVCALSVVSHTSRHSAEGLRDFALDRMRNTAEQMSRALAEVDVGPPARTPDRDHSLDAKRELGPEYLQSLARGLSVLAALDRPAGMTLSAVAEATALPRATARRSLLTLEHLGYVAIDADGHRFAPLPRVLDLGYSPLSALSLAELAQPHLTALVRELHESASVAVLDGDDVRYIARVAAGRIMSVAITVGTRFPAHATSLGRVLLAGLPNEHRARWLRNARLESFTDHTVTSADRLAAVLEQAAHDGFALVDQELEEGLRSIAVPLLGRDGQVIAAANVSLHAGRTSADEALRTVLPALRAAAERISADVALVSDAHPLPFA